MLVFLMLLCVPVALQECSLEVPVGLRVTAGCWRRAAPGTAGLWDQHGRAEPRAAVVRDSGCLGGGLLNQEREGCFIALVENKRILLATI